MSANPSPAGTVSIWVLNAKTGPGPLTSRASTLKRAGAYSISFTSKPSDASRSRAHCATAPSPFLARGG